MTERVKAKVRYELKYIVTWRQRDTILAELARLMVPDSHGDDDGNYTITSLYYDTPDHKAYWDKVEGYRLRRKVRVRVYGNRVVTPETHAFLEIKERDYKTLQKRRVALPYSQAIDFEQLEGKLGVDQHTSDTLQEVYYLYRVLHLQPTCIVRYNRLAYNGDAYHPDLRVTFDTDVKYRIHDLSLLETGYAEDSYVLPPDWCIMEIKANQSMPFWLAQIVSRQRCTAQRISKYCAALERSQIVLSNRQFTV